MLPPIIRERKAEVKLQKRKRNRFLKTSLKKINSSNKISSLSSQDENFEGRKTIFKTFKADNQTDSQCQMKKMMRQMKNRISARKCRQKKKIYVKQMEEEIADLKSKLVRYKNIEKKENRIENMIRSVR